MTYYEILEVPATADAVEIKKAFRRLALKYHPDVSNEPEAETRFKLIYIAYEILTDPFKRSLYDEMQKYKQEEEANPNPSMDDWHERAGQTAHRYSSMKYEEFEDTLLTKIVFHSRQSIALLFCFILLCISMICLGLGWHFLTGKYMNGTIVLSGVSIVFGGLLFFIAGRALLEVFRLWRQ